MNDDMFPPEDPETEPEPDTDAEVAPSAPAAAAAPGAMVDAGAMMVFFSELTERLRAPAPPAEPPAEKEEAPQPELVFANAIAWFDGWCRHVYRRKLPGRGTSPNWREDWWRDPEARTRIDSIWRAWEKLRLDPATGMSVWFKDHGDYHMGVLMGEGGPFATEDSPKSKLGTPLPHERPNDALLGDERDVPAPGLDT
ncbi:DUF4913 domain-containing protein [Leucobacter sp. HNU]|uniref:DUF4913 domain-containing protein n=1 Tax=Leucobacter sp. HNU TaxID=3236805 RepID=UPI003A8070B7